MTKRELNEMVKHAYKMQNRTINTKVLFKVYSDGFYILDTEEDNVIEICENEIEAIDCCETINSPTLGESKKSNCYYKPFLADESTGNMINRENFKFYDKDTFEAAKKDLPELPESITTRFKILALLALNVGVWEEKMEILGNQLEDGHPQSIEALKFYEDKIIEVLSMEKEPETV